MKTCRLSPITCKIWAKSMKRSSIVCHRADTWLERRYYTTGPQRLPGVFRLHMIITDWWCVVGFSGPPTVASSLWTFWDHPVWFSLEQYWGLNSSWACAQVMAGAGWGQNDFVRMRPHISEGGRACTGILFNNRITATHCGTNVLAGSFSSRLIGQTVKVRLQ